MQIADLITLAENRLAFLANQRENATRTGDVDELVRIDQEASSTQETLDQLRTL